MSEQGKGYNGWTNYETWVVKLWMDNEQETYLFWQEQTRLAWKHCRNKYPNQYLDRKRNTVHYLANQIKEYHQSEQPTSSGVWTDLITAALGEVNWIEIAESLLEAEEVET